MNARLFGTLAVFASAMVSSHFAHAQAGDAGCGLGSMVIQEQTKVMQILAATTNQITLSQLGGISTGTSNCRAQNIVMREKAVQYFAEVNKDDLSREMAQGSGEKLKALASLYGCQGEAQGSFAKMTQSAYERILPTSATPANAMVQNLNSELKSNIDLAKTCHAI